jgi:pimeloyl-ACP methyl ester carboxylesterase
MMAAFAAPAVAQTQRLVTEEMMVTTADPGIEIYVRNKRPADMKTFRPEMTVLYVHGATYPSETAFDLKLDDLSWMEYIASRGYDVWLLDLRGYGKSTRPAEMADRPEANPPIVRGVTAVKDIGTAVDFILQRRNIPRLNLLGWSWGTTLMATYTTENAQKVERLVLYAPVWIRQTPSLVQTGPGPLGAYRMVNREQARERWYTGVADDKKAALIPPGWFDAWADATFATDPVGAQMTPPVVRAPNGVMQDSSEFFGAGKPYCDPAKITAGHGNRAPTRDQPREASQGSRPQRIGTGLRCPPWRAVRHTECALGNPGLTCQRRRSSGSAVRLPGVFGHASRAATLVCCPAT